MSMCAAALTPQDAAVQAQTSNPAAFVHELYIVFCSGVLHYLAGFVRLQSQLSTGLFGMKHMLMMFAIAAGSHPLSGA